MEAAARGEGFIIAKAGKPLVKVVAIDAPGAGARRRLGFLAGRSVPEDFDRMGAAEVEAKFGGWSQALARHAPAALGGGGAGPAAGGGGGADRGRGERAAVQRGEPLGGGDQGRARAGRFAVDAGVLRRGLVDNGYEELAVTGAHAAAVAALPPLHRDPFDRMLVAQALVEGVSWSRRTGARGIPGAVRVV